MRFWMRNKFKSLFSAPDHHLVQQVMLLLNNQMPYATIQQSLGLQQESLDEFVKDLYKKAKNTYSNLSIVFSQTQLLQLHVQLSEFQRSVTRTITIKSVYPFVMSLFSYACFLFFYRVLYPMFLTLSDTHKLSFLRGYAVISISLLTVFIVGIILFFNLMKIPFQQTLVLRSLHKKYPNSILFDYYANVFTLVYNLCLSFEFSSLMTIELLRGLHDYPYLQAVAYDIHQECQQGLSLHKAIMKQKLSLVLNQTIDLGIAANDLPTYMMRLIVSYRAIFMSKLKRNLVIVNLCLYSFMMINLTMVILILQLPTRIMGELL